MEFTTMLVRILISFIFSFLFGMERERKNKPAGIGAFVFVAISSCALSILALELVMENPVYLLASTVTGVGFLGAGILIKTRDRVFGVTTAASVWLFSVLGLLLGMGYYIEAFVLYILVWFVVVFDAYYMGLLEKATYHKKLSVRTNRIIEEGGIRKNVMKYVINCRLIHAEIDKKGKTSSFTYLIEGKKDMKRIVDKMREIEWIEYYRLE